MRRIATLCILVSLAGCASRPDSQPEDDPARYPALEVLTGRGEGASAEEARDRARADLAKIFEAEVLAQSEDEQSFDSAGGGYAARAARLVSVRTERMIEGVEIARSWIAPATGRHHAIAVLSRGKSAHALREEIERLDEATRVHLRRAGEASDPLLRIDAAARALAAQGERAGRQRALRVIDPSGVGMPSPWNLGRMQADFDALLQRVRLGLRIGRDTTGSLAPILEGAVRAAGFREDAAPDYFLEASLSLQGAGPIDGWYWQHGVLELRILDAHGGRSRGARRWPLKAAALDEGLAVQRALEAAERALRQDLTGTLIGKKGGDQWKLSD